ncbi:MAG: hypothetical protein P4M13_08165 [Alphaproteobacteria bacterium]|nr:hypothetical protein [Alphaproteobacteria bacterium]
MKMFTRNADGSLEEIPDNRPETEKPVVMLRPTKLIPFAGGYQKVEYEEATYPNGNISRRLVTTDQGERRLDYMHTMKDGAYICFIGSLCPNGNFCLVTEFSKNGITVSHTAVIDNVVVDRNGEIMYGKSGERTLKTSWDGRMWKNRGVRKKLHTQKFTLKHQTSHLVPS